MRLILRVICIWRRKAAAKRTERDICDEVAVRKHMAAWNFWWALGRRFGVKEWE